MATTGITITGLTELPPIDIEATFDQTFLDSMEARAIAFEVRKLEEIMAGAGLASNARGLAGVNLSVVLGDVMAASARATVGNAILEFLASIYQTLMQERIAQIQQQGALDRTRLEIDGRLELLRKENEYFETHWAEYLTRFDTAQTNQNASINAVLTRYDDAVGLFPDAEQLGAVGEAIKGLGTAIPSSVLPDPPSR